MCLPRNWERTLIVIESPWNLATFSSRSFSMVNPIVRSLNAHSSFLSSKIQRTVNLGWISITLRGFFSYGTCLGGKKGRGSQWRCDGWWSWTPPVYLADYYQILREVDVARRRTEKSLLRETRLKSELGVVEVTGLLLFFRHFTH